MNKIAVLLAGAVFGATAAQAETAMVAAPYYGFTPMTQEQAQAMVEQRQKAWRAAMEMQQKMVQDMADRMAKMREAPTGNPGEMHNPMAMHNPWIMHNPWLMHQASMIDMARQDQEMRKEMAMPRDEMFTNPRMPRTREGMAQYREERRAAMDKLFQQRRKDFEAARKAADEEFAKVSKDFPEVPFPFARPAI